MHSSPRTTRCDSRNPIPRDYRRLSIINRWNPIDSLVSVIDIPPSAVGYIPPASPLVCRLSTDRPYLDLLRFPLQIMKDARSRQYIKTNRLDVDEQNEFSCALWGPSDWRPVLHSQVFSSTNFVLDHHPPASLIALFALYTYPKQVEKVGSIFSAHRPRSAMNETQAIFTVHRNKSFEIRNLPGRVCVYSESPARLPIILVDPPLSSSFIVGNTSESICILRAQIFAPVVRT